MFGSRVQVCVTGSNMLAMFWPMNEGSSHSWPPTTNTRPSARTVGAEQNRSRMCDEVSLGAGVNVLVATSQTVAEEAPMHAGPPSHMRILPVVSRTMCMSTIGMGEIGPHCPMTAGSAEVFDTFSVRAAEVVGLPAASRARAVSMWAPLPTVRESHEIEYGDDVSSAPTAKPSTRNCTPTTPTL